MTKRSSTTNSGTLSSKRKRMSMRRRRRRRRIASTTQQSRGLVSSGERVSEVIVAMRLYPLTIKHYLQDSAVCCKMRCSYAPIENGVPPGHFCVFKPITLQYTTAGFKICGPPFFLLSCVLFVLTKPRLRFIASQLSTRITRTTERFVTMIYMYYQGAGF